MNFEKGSKMNVFKNVVTFKNKEGKEEKFFRFSSNITKGKDKQIERMPIRVQFIGDLKENAETKMLEDVCYTIEIQKGFLTFESWQEKDGNKKFIPVVVISECKVLQTKECGTKNNPF